jgi:tetratricopeptide (TPR) repeat protein
MSHRFLLIGLDAADWQLLHPLIDAGDMPAFSRLVEGGSSGQLLGVQPLVPAMLWTSMVTGKRAWQHGICHSTELAQDGRQLKSISSFHRRSTSLWQILAHEGKRCVAIGWPGTHGERSDNSIIVSDRYPDPTAGPGVRPWPPAELGTYWPLEVGSRLDAKRVSPEDIGPSVISNYIPNWKKIDQKRDHRLGQLRLLLAADYSYQTAALELLKEEKWDFAAIRFPALAPISRLFMPHHLSAQSGSGNEDLEIYRDVIRSSCRILDHMLHQIIELAGPKTAVMVVSGHGVRTLNIPAGGFSPKDNESWKSSYGIFTACGPKFASDALLHGAGVLDIAPTVLTWFGLPIGDDMEGRVLVESFALFPEIARIDSWETWMGILPAPTHDKTDLPISNAADAWRREADWNRVQSCLEASRYQEALPILNRLFCEFPERVEVCHALFQCQMALGHLSDAADTLEVALESIPPGISSLLPRAELAVAKSDFKLARSLVGEAMALKPTHPMALRKLGLLLLRLRDWDALAEIAKQALKMDEQEPLAWLGLAAAQLRKGNASEAVEAATRAIQLRYFMPDAHFVLARGLVAQGRWLEAKEAMQVLLKLQPDNRAAATYFKRLPREDGSSKSTIA